MWFLLALFDLAVTAGIHAPWYWYVIGLCSILFGTFGLAAFGLALCAFFHAPWWIWVIGGILAFLAFAIDEE